MEKLTLKEKIDRAKDGRSQSWLVKKLSEKGVKITEHSFSRKKNGYDKFTEQEINLIESILKVKI
jgi:hypothetical protein